jgi:GAF domain-containing protein
MLSPSRELEFLKFLDNLSQYLKSTRELRKALTFALRESRAFFQADSGCVAVAEAGDTEAQLLLAVPRDDSWDLQHVGRFIRHTHPPIRSDVVMAPVRRRGAAWGAMAFMRSHPAFDRDDGRLLARITAVVSEAIQAMDRERMLEVRDRIDRRIMELIHPKDLFYQILAGLRSLTQYDHSSALLIRDRDENTLRVVAEQIAWAKARSHRIGLTLPIEPELQSVLTSAEIHGFDRHGDAWRAWTGKPVARLAELLDYNRAGKNAGEAREASMLCAPLVLRDGMIGILKVAARHPGRLKPYDAELVDRFRSQAAVAIQNLTRTESLQARILTAERKHAIADLARTVSHDVNNALGSMLPLVQQMQADLQAGKMESAV